jgi:hypothetical protein
VHGLSRRSRVAAIGSLSLAACKAMQAAGVKRIQSRDLRALQPG